MYNEPFSFVNSVIELASSNDNDSSARKLKNNISYFQSEDITLENLDELEKRLNIN